MKLAIVAFTKTGAELAKRIGAMLIENGNTCLIAASKNAALSCGVEETGDLKSWTERVFSQMDGLIFVGASGIAVRTVAPFLKDKFTDPAIVSVDELGQFAVPLVSGHIGGANALAREIAKITGGTAVISTATDVQGLFAVDEWAANQGLVIADRTAAKEISAALLDGEKIGFRSDFPVYGKLPNSIETSDSGRIGIYITVKDSIRPFETTLLLHPKAITLGIGCRKGTPAQVISDAVFEALSEAGISVPALKDVASIDLKADEQGLLDFCSERELPLTTYTAQELSKISGDFTPSAFVEEITGVSNVCERSAVAAGGTLIIKKQAGKGVTVAAAIAPFSLSFPEEME